MMILSTFLVEFHFPGNLRLQFLEPVLEDDEMSRGTAVGSLIRAAVTLREPSALDLCGDDTVSHSVQLRLKGG